MAPVFVVIGSLILSVAPAGATHGPGVELCSTILGPGAIGNTFTFQVGDQSVNITGGGCRTVQIPVGVVTTVTEQADPLFELADLTVTPPATRVGSADIPGRRVQVRLTPGRPSTHVTFVNRPAPGTGFLVMCKAYQGRPPKNLSYQLTSGPNHFSGSDAACSPAFVVDSGDTTVVETTHGRVRLVEVATSPSGRLITTDLPAGRALVRVVAGQTTTATFIGGLYGDEDKFSLVEVCKVAGPGIPVGQNFIMSLTPGGVGGQLRNIPAGLGPVGNCSVFQVIVPGSAAAISEQNSTFPIIPFQLTSITTSAPGTMISTDLANKGAVVQPGPAGTTTRVIFTNSAVPLPQAGLRVCKVAGAGVPVNTPATFVVGGSSVTVAAGPGPTGTCSDPVMVAANSSVAVHENVPSNTQVTSITANGTGNLVSSDLPNGDALVQVGPGGTGLSVTYTNQALTKGLLKVCKIAGPGVAVGAPYNFTASGTPFIITAGSSTSAPPGNCAVVGSYPVGSTVSVDENVPANNQVDSISVEPSTAVVSGSTDLTAGTVVVTIGSGVTEVTYTDKSTGFVEVCSGARGPGVTGDFQFNVGGRLFSASVGQCTGPIEVPAGRLSVTEVLRSGFRVVRCTTFPAGALVTNCDHSKPSAVVRVAFGGISAQTVLTFLNESSPPAVG